MSDIGFAPPGLGPDLPPELLAQMLGGMGGAPMPPPPPPMPEPPPPPPPPFMGKDPEGLLVSFKRWYDRDSMHWKSWRERAEEDFAFLALDQWTEEEKKILEAELRVPIVFDRIGPIVEAVVGQQVSNRQEARYIPREMGDVQVNEYVTGAAQWFLDVAGAESEETAAFKDVLTCGLGCVEISLEYETSAEGTPKVDQVDIMEMLVDCSARKTNLLDARRVWRVKQVPLEEAESMFPDADVGDLDATWADPTKVVDSSGSESQGRRYYDKEQTSDGLEIARDGYVTLVECQWWEREAVYRIIDPFTGEESELSEEDYAAFMERMIEAAPMLMAQGIAPPQEGVRQMRRVYYKAFIGSKVLEVTPTIDPKAFSYKFITGYKDRNKGTWIGLVTKMKDPQRWANKWLSQTLHILNSQAGSGLMMEEEQRVEPDKFETDWTRPNSVIKFKNGALTNGKIKEKPAVQFPAGYNMLMEFAGNAVREASGVNLEQLGMREAVQPGVLEYQRRQSGVQVLAGLFDALRRFHFEAHKTILVIIQDHLSDGRLIRIAGEGVNNEELIRLTRDRTLGEFDIIIDESPTSPNQKETTWQIIQSLLPYFGEMIMGNPMVAAELLSATPLPSSLVESLRAAMTPPEPTEEEMMAKEMEMAAQQEMIRSLSAGATKDEAQAMNLQAQAHLNEMRAQETMSGSAINVDHAQAAHYRALAAYHEAKARQAGVETFQAMQPPPRPIVVQQAPRPQAPRPQAPRPQAPRRPQMPMSTMQPTVMQRPMMPPMVRPMMRPPMPQRPQMPVLPRR